MTASRAPVLAGASELGGYTIVRELGSRSPPTFVVQRARDGGVPEIVVVERWRREDVGADATATVVRAGKRLATLTHPNLVRVRDVEVRADEVLVVGDFVDGERYDALLLVEAAARAGAGRRVPLVVHLRILVDVLGGLSGLHLLRDAMNEPMRLVHREACPANVLLGLDGNARLAHVCRAHDVRGCTEATGYLAPEVRLGDKGVDARADVYSCGVMLWEALRGARLFPESNDLAILPRQLRDKIERVNLPSDLAWAQPLADVAARALAADPTARFANAADMAAEVRKVAGAKLALKAALASLVKEACGEHISSRRRDAGRLDAANATSGTVATEESGEILVRASGSRMSLPTPAMAIPRDVLERALAGADDEPTVPREQRAQMPAAAADPKPAVKPAAAKPPPLPPRRSAALAPDGAGGQKPSPPADKAVAPVALPTADIAPDSSASIPIAPRARVAPPTSAIIAIAPAPSVAVPPAPPPVVAPTSSSRLAVAPRAPVVAAAAPVVPELPPSAIVTPLPEPLVDAATRADAGVGAAEEEEEEDVAVEFDAPTPALEIPRSSPATPDAAFALQASYDRASGDVAFAVPPSRGRRARLGIVVGVVGLMLLLLIAAGVRAALRAPENPGAPLAHPTASAPAPAKPTATPTKGRESDAPPAPTAPPTPTVTAAPTAPDPAPKSTVAPPTVSAAAPAPTVPPRKAPRAKGTYDPLGI